MRSIFIPILVAGLLAEVLSDREWCGKNDTFKHPAKGTCVGYWNCDKGNITYKRCSTFYTFDSEKSECVWNPTGNAVVPCGSETGHSADDKWCSIGKTYRAPVNGLCRSYYDCQNGYLELRSCMWPSSFNPHERECRINFWPYEFKCYTIQNEESSTVNSSEPEVSTSSSSPTSAISSPDISTSSPDISTSSPQGCSQGENYITVFPNDCSKYYSCKNGSLSVQDCEYFKKFDPSTLLCRYSYPWNPVNCNAPVATTTIQPSTITSKMTTVATTQQTTITTTKQTTVASTKRTTAATTHSPPHPENRFICLKGNYYMTPYPNDCQKYILCSNSSLSVRECSTMHRFNPLTHQCEVNIPWIRTVNCSAKTDKPYCTAGYNYKTSFPGNSKKYYLCSNGTLTVKTCGVLQSYAKDKQSCKYSIFGLRLDLNEEHVKICKKSGNYNTTYDGNCLQYNSCFNGTMTTLDCPYGQRYDGVTGRCVPMRKCDLLTCNDKGPLCYKGVDYLAPVPDDCKKYSECKDGSWSIKECPTLTRFDPTTRTCRLLSLVDCNAKIRCNGNELVDVKLSNSLGTKNKLDEAAMELMITNQDLKTPECRRKDHFNAVYTKDCSKYYSCRNGTLKVEQCSTFDKFDPKILECRFDSPWNSVDCNSLPGQPACAHGQHFKAIFPEYCEKYYNCNNGSLSVESCHFWQKFDPATHECRLSIPWMYSVNCSAKHLGQTTLIASKSIHVKNSKQATAFLKGPSCGKGQEFKSVYADDCQKYFDCNNGTETVEKCFWLKKFNPAMLKCEWDLPFYRVNCSSVPGSGLPKPIVYPSSVRSRCQSGISFKAIVEGHCDSYYDCSNGSLSYQHCGWLKKFNPKTLECSFNLPFDRVNCTSLPGEPSCPKTGLIRTPFPGDCAKYYECNKGTLSIESCGFLKKFDHKKHTCSYDLPLDRVDCGAD